MFTGWTCNDEGTIFRPNGKPVTKTKKDDGYLIFREGGKMHRYHRVVFLLHNGYWAKEVDHKDRDRANTRPDNLRDVDRSTNNLNTKVRSDNKLGHKGVYPHKSGKYQVQICWKGKVKTKLVADYDDAVALRKQWELDRENNCS